MKRLLCCTATAILFTILVEGAHSQDQKFFQIKGCFLDDDVMLAAVQKDWHPEWKLEARLGVADFLYLPMPNRLWYRADFKRKLCPDGKTFRIIIDRQDEYGGAPFPLKPLKAEKEKAVIAARNKSPR